MESLGQYFGLGLWVVTVILVYVIFLRNSRRQRQGDDVLAEAGRINSEALEANKRSFENIERTERLLKREEELVERIERLVRDKEQRS